MFASARDILGSKRYRKTYQPEGLDKPVEIIGLTQSGVAALHVISQKSDSAAQINAWLIKQCCPAFKWWSLSKIHNRLPVPVVVDLVREIMNVSGLGKNAVEDSLKKSESNPGSDSS